MSQGRHGLSSVHLDLLMITLQYSDFIAIFWVLVAVEKLKMSHIVLLMSSLLIKHESLQVVKI